MTCQKWPSNHYQQHGDGIPQILPAFRFLSNSSINLSFFKVLFFLLLFLLFLHLFLAKIIKSARSSSTSASRTKETLHLYELLGFELIQLIIH